MRCVVDCYRRISKYNEGALEMEDSYSVVLIVCRQI
jgi:hypothetical protein